MSDIADDADHFLHLAGAPAEIDLTAEGVLARPIASGDGFADDGDSRCARAIVGGRERTTANQRDPYRLEVTGGGNTLL